MSSGFEVIGEYFVIPGLRGACHEAPIGAFQWADLSARSGRFVEPDQADATCPVPLAKIFMFSFDPNHLHVARVPAHTQGAFRDRHERKVGMRWTRAALLTRALICGRRSRVVLTPRRRRQVSQKCLRGDGDKKARSSGRVRNKLLKPSRAGMPGDPGATVVTSACAYYTSRTRLRVQRAPGIPRSPLG
jgi:hypothetical protein